MKQLTCEMCGSTDLIKQDGVFVCQSCGCKYSVEEAKKLMIEGTVSISGPVKIDNEATIENLFLLARREWKNSNFGKAGEYYNQLLLERPNDWEVSFYSTLCQAANCKVVAISSEALLVKNGITAAIPLAKETDNTSEAYKRIAEDSLRIINMLFGGAKSVYSDIARQLQSIYDPLQNKIPTSHYESMLNTMREFEGRYNACVAALSEYGYQYNALYEATHDETYKLYALNAWKRIFSMEYEVMRASMFCANPDNIGELYSGQFGNILKNVQRTAAPFLEKIRKYERAMFLILPKEMPKYLLRERLPTRKVVAMSLLPSMGRMIVRKCGHFGDTGTTPLRKPGTEERLSGPIMP